MRRLLPATLLLAACAAAPDAPPQPERPAPTAAAARDLQYTETFELHWGDELAGYLVEVLPAPAGIADARAFRPGTSLIEGPDFALLGFISPHGTTYRFDAEGTARPVGWGSREQGITAFFGRNGPPRLVPVTSVR